MFCEKCGHKTEKGTKFCINCGNRISDETLPRPLSTTHKEEGAKMNIFYSPEWRRKNGFNVASVPCFDVLIDKDNFYLIKIKKYHSSTLGLFLGLLIGNILGAYIGASIGESSDKKKRQWYRSAWVDENNNVTSRNYEHDVFIKIPLNELKNSITFHHKKNKVKIKYNGKEIVLGRRVRSFRAPDRKEINRLMEYTKNYVL